MSVSFPGSDALTAASSGSTVPGFDVLFPSTPSSSASSSPTTTPSTTSTLSPVDSYQPTAGAAINEGTPVDLNQPGATLADGSTVPGDPTGLSSDQIQSASSTDPFWATDAPSSDFNTPVPGFNTLFPSGTENNSAATIQNTAAATPTTYQALDKQIQAASDTELLADLGSGSSTQSSEYAAGSDASTLSGVSTILSAISTGYQAGVYGGGTGLSFDTTA